MLLDLRHNLHGHRSQAYFRLLLAYQPVYLVQHLVAQAGLPDSPRASRQHERPQHGCGHQANRADGGLVHPSLLADHRYSAPGRVLDNHAQSRLHADQHREITTLLQLHHHLIFIADLLHFIPLYAIFLFKVSRESFDIDFFRVIKSGIHYIFSFIKSTHSTPITYTAFSDES